MSTYPSSTKLFVVLPPATANDSAIFGVNSVRPIHEVQDVVYLPASKSVAETMVKCTYIELERKSTNATVLCRPFGSWGAEMGGNEHGVCIGCSQLQNSDAITSGLTAHDLVRLGLERADNAHEAVKTISELVEEHGLFCGNGPDPAKPAEAGFLICDRAEAWVVEVSGRHWVAQRVTSGWKCLNGSFTIQTNFEESSADLKQFAMEHHGWTQSDGELNFARVFSSQTWREEQEGDARYFKHLVENANGAFTLESMLDVLRHEEVESCPDGFVVASSQVSLLPPGSPDVDTNQVCTHWITGTPIPSLSFFKPFVFVGGGAGTLEGTTTKVGAQGHALWAAHRGFRERLGAGEGRAAAARENVRQLEASCTADVDQLTASTSSCDQAASSGSLAEPTTPISLFQHLVDLEINFY